MPTCSQLNYFHYALALELILARLHCRCSRLLPPWRNVRLLRIPQAMTSTKIQSYARAAGRRRVAPGQPPGQLPATTGAWPAAALPPGLASNRASLQTVLTMNGTALRHHWKVNHRKVVSKCMQEPNCRQTAEASLQSRVDNKRYQLVQPYRVLWHQDVCFANTSREEVTANSPG
jgi:hypothetical protein